MGLLNLFTQQGSVYTALDGATPPNYVPNPNTVTNNLTDSTLDKNGDTTPVPRTIPLDPLSLVGGQSTLLFWPIEPQGGSTLDLNGTTPPKYLDNLPG